MDTFEFDLSKIKEYRGYKKISEVEYGWSGDRKFYILDEFGTEYLLRISDKKRFKRRKSQFKQLSRFNELDINITKVIRIGRLGRGNIYTLTTWVKGSNCRDHIRDRTQQEQYALGENMGNIMRELHSIKYRPRIGENWKKQLILRTNNALSALDSFEHLVEGHDIIRKYILNNVSSIEDRPLVVAHGDCHSGNMVMDNDSIGLVDFDKCKIVDPYFEFASWWWNVMEGDYFQTGIIDGYFDNKIPNDFFKILSIYSAIGVCNYVKWASNYDEVERNKAVKVFAMVVDAWDNFKIDIPKWYMNTD